MNGNDNKPAQPATTTVAAQEAVAYLDIGAGGYLDLGSDLPEEQILALPKGRHALGIIGTYGIDGYVAALRAAPEGFVMVPVELALRVEDSLGRFVSDEGWGTADMQAADDLSGLLAARPPAGAKSCLNP